MTDLTDVTTPPRDLAAGVAGAVARRRGRRRAGWRGIAGDVLVVVVGILIAFTLDSWWTGRAAARREEAHLRALRSDFETNVERLRAEIRYEEQISENSLRLLLLARSDEPVAPDTVRRLLYQVFTSGHFSPVMGAYEALVNSGGLTQIRDDSLRAALADFASLLENRYWEEYSNAQYFALLGYITGRTDYFIDYLLAANASDSTGPTRVPSPASAARDAELLRSPAFQHHLAVRHGAERDVARRYRELAGRAERILDRVNRLLEN